MWRRLDCGCFSMGFQVGLCDPLGQHKQTRWKDWLRTSLRSADWGNSGHVHPFLGACHEISLISGCFHGPSFWWTLGQSQVSAIWSAEHQLNDSFGTFNSWVSCVHTHVDRQVRNAPKRGNSTQLKVPRVLAGHRPQSLTSLSEPENNESFKPSKHVLERQRKWHQHAKEVQCHLNQGNWHHQASEGLGKSCCGPSETLRNGEAAPSWRFHGS